MDIRTRAAAYGIAGLVLSGIAIFAGSFSGALTAPSGGFNPASPGFLSIMLTDPPSVPQNVTGVFVTYSNVGIHAVGLGGAEGSSGWVWTGDSGTVETLGLVNTSQTISAGSVPTGRYNAIAFLVSSVAVEYNGQNYSAAVASGRLLLPFPEGLQVNGSAPSAALIDINPVILNLGTQSTPNFVFTTAGHALQLPRTEFVQDMRNVGFRMGLLHRPWYQAFVAAHMHTVSANSVNLSASSFSLTITGPASESSTVRAIILSPGAVNPHGRLNALASSFVFAVKPDGSLQLISFGSLSPGTIVQIRQAMQSAGFVLAAGATATFSFSGTITTLLTGQGVASGDTYNVTVVGPNTFGINSVTAS